MTLHERLSQLATALPSDAAAVTLTPSPEVSMKCGTRKAREVLLQFVPILFPVLRGLRIA